MWLTRRRFRAIPMHRVWVRDRLVPFSCHGRAVCPSCGPRRMAERAALGYAFEQVTKVRRLPVNTPVLTAKAIRSLK